ncbi:MAG: PAS domain S-box-containing protein [Candidatus Latescibacterota bacterium]|jgi:PAS domain S-box-containing protein
MAEDLENDKEHNGEQGEVNRLRQEVDRLWSRDVAQELRLSEAKYRALIEGSSDFIYVLDKDGHFTFANREIEHLLGYSPEEIMGKHFSTVLHPEEADSLKHSFAERRTGERATHRVEVRLQSRGGVMRDVEIDIRHFSLSASGIYRDEDFIGTHGVARDITERKYTEKKQRALGELHRAIWSMARVDDVQLVLDGIGDTLAIIDFPYAEFGVYVIDMDEPPIVQLYSTFQSKGVEHKAQWMVNDSESFAATIVNTWRRGTLVHCRSLEREESGHDRSYLSELYGPIESIADVPFSHGVLTITTHGTRFSARDLLFLDELADCLSDSFRRVEDLKELTLSEQRYRRIVETPNLVILLMDTDGNFIYVSPQIERWLGYTPQDFFDDPAVFLRVVHAEDQENARSILQANSSQRDIEYRWTGTDNKHHWASASAFPVYENEGDALINRASMIQIVVQDISERKRAEDLIVSSLGEKEILLKEIHHRVKNNLQIISSLLDLQSRDLEGSLKNVFEDSQNRINSMALIHEELYNSGDLARIDFETYARNLANNLMSTYSPTGVLLDLKVDALPLNLDRAIPMGLIINELVSNALKYAFPDSRKGHIYITLNTTGEDSFVLKVSDDGIGIKGEINQKNPSTLGLKLVYTLAMQLKGRVELDCEGGTNFSIIRS